MKEFSISVQTSGNEYYIVKAETFEEAVELIKNGEVYSNSSEVEWSSDFYLEDVEEI